MVNRGQMLQIVAKETGLCCVETKSVNVITRPHLITIVEKLEEITGIKLCDDSNRPLAWTDVINPTFSDYFDFLEGKVDCRLRKLREKPDGVVQSPQPAPAAKRKAMSDDQKRIFSEKARNSFLSNLSKEKRAEVTDETRITSLPYDGIDWITAIYFMEDALGVQLDAHVENIIDDETTLAQLVELFVAAK